MGVVTGPAKGKSVQIALGESNKERVLIGLRWNANELSKSDKVGQTLSGIKDVLTGPIMMIRANIARLHEKYDDYETREEDDPNYDLDLACFAFDKSGQLHIVVDQDAWNAIDDSGKVYHTGDHETGESSHDDEQIFIELKGLSEEVSSFFFIVTSDCAHTLGNVDTPEIRFAESKTEKDFLRVRIDQLPENDRYAYVFCKFYRDSQNNWHVQNISEFASFEENWPEYLKQYL